MSKQYGRIVVPFIGASIAFAALQWLQWAATGGPSRHGMPSPVWWCVGLTANVVLTLASHRWKRFVFRLFQKYLLNPPIRLLLHLGLMPLGFALLETRGRKTGQARRNPVGNGLAGDTFWIIAEHGETKLLTVRVDLSPAADRRTGSRSAAGTLPESSPIAAGTPS
jgi:hypothetical protein